MAMPVAGQFTADGGPVPAKVRDNLGIGKANHVKAGDLITLFAGKVYLQHRGLRCDWVFE